MAKSNLSKIHKLLKIAVFGVTTKTAIAEIISSLLIILFIYTGISKIFDYANFRFQLGRSPFLQPFAGFIALTLPEAEIAIALLLIFTQTRLFGLYISFFLMALFTGYIFIMLQYSYDLPCSCGGVLAKMTWHDHLIFNSAFTILSMIGIILQKSKSLSPLKNNKIQEVI